MLQHWPGLSPFISHMLQHPDNEQFTKKAWNHVGWKRQELHVLLRSGSNVSLVSETDPEVAWEKTQGNLKRMFLGSCDQEHVMLPTFASDLLRSHACP